MNYRKFRRNVKGISPIIATLLLIAIAVVAALVVYAWVMGYVGFQTTTDANSAVIQSVQWATNGAAPNPDSLTAVYLQNVGSGGISFIPTQCLYLNGAPMTITSLSINGVAATVSGTAVSLPAQGTATIVLTAGTPNAFVSGAQVTIKIASTGSTYSQATEQAP